jgi:hypothetical protein
MMSVNRLTPLMPAALLSVGLTASPAHAQGDPYEICGYYENSLYVNVPESPCLNAWGGGPYLNAHSPGVSHEDFAAKSVDRNGTYYYQLEYLPDGPCVGDYGGGSGDAGAAMNDTCNGSNGYGGSYGTLFDYYSDGCPNGGGVFCNVHWGGNLYAAEADGSAYYLNSASGTCQYEFTLSGGSVQGAPLPVGK